MFAPPGLETPGEQESSCPFHCYVPCTYSLSPIDIYVMALRGVTSHRIVIVGVFLRVDGEGLEGCLN